MRPLFLILVLVSAVLAQATHAKARFALVIGNDTYADVPQLDLARADAVAIADALTAQGFTVTSLLDGTRRATNRRISDFTRQLQPGDTAFVFYAGHGVEIDGENYLLPVDIPAPTAAAAGFIKSESIALSALLDRIRATGARTTIAIIDACRDNPFATATGRSIGRTRGLGRINAPEGMFVIFSAGAGQKALDRLSAEDSAANSVFTRKLLPLLSRPDLELRQLVARLRVDVRDLARTVNHDQVPAYYDELLGEFYFTPAAAPTPVATPDPAATAQSDPQTRAARIREDFALARSVGTIEAYDAFLDRYSDAADDFSVQLALRLRDQLAESPAALKVVPSQSETVRASQPDTDPAPDPADKPAQPDKPALSERQIIRQTQRHLNALGCNAGKPDGLAGRKTRKAFVRFLQASGSTLGIEALGTQAGLDAVTAVNAAPCPVAAAKPAARPKAEAVAEATTGQTPATPTLSLAGTWSFSAKCALFIESKGTAQIRHVRDNFYTGTIRDNLGNQGHSEIYLNGRTITATEYFPGLTVHFRGRLAADGRSYTGSGSNTCKVYARKS